MKKLKKPILPHDYTSFLVEVKERIRSAQYDALRAVNKELVGLYWDIGKMIVTRQQSDKTWGKSVVEQLSADLRTEFPPAHCPGVQTIETHASPLSLSEGAFLDYHVNHFQCILYCSSLRLTSP